MPRFFWPLVVYAALTLVSAAFSPDPRTSFIDSKQLVLFLIVPMVYQFGRGARATTVLKVIITVGADQRGARDRSVRPAELQQARPAPAGRARPLHDVFGSAAAGHRRRASRTAAVRLARPRLGRDGDAGARSSRSSLTFTRSAWVGACAAATLLFVMKDLRLVAVAAGRRRALLRAGAGAITDRFYSMFDLNDPTNRDRMAMLREGARDDRDASADRRRSEHGAAPLCAVPRSARGREA